MADNGMVVSDWNVEKIGYKPLNTFYVNFSFDEWFGFNRVKSSYESIMAYWRDDYRYITELAMVLKWKCCTIGNDEWSNGYRELYNKCDDYIRKNFSEEELRYYLDLIERVNKCVDNTQ